MMVEKFNMTRNELIAGYNTQEELVAELLEALKAAYESISKDPDIYWKGDTLADMEQAIAKAEGDNNG